jgi:hypothetical protein
VSELSDRSDFGGTLIDKGEIMLSLQYIVVCDHECASPAVLTGLIKWILVDN